MEVSEREKEKGKKWEFQGGGGRFYASDPSRNRVFVCSALLCLKEVNLFIVD